MTGKTCHWNNIGHSTTINNRLISNKHGGEEQIQFRSSMPCTECGWAELGVVTSSIVSIFFLLFPLRNKTSNFLSICVSRVQKINKSKSKRNSNIIWTKQREKRKITENKTSTSNDNYFWLCFQRKPTTIRIIIITTTTTTTEEVGKNTEWKQI